jgi:hypothetical protein
LLAVSDHASAGPADRVWHFDRRKLVLMADHTLPKLTSIDQARRAKRAS